MTAWDDIRFEWGRKPFRLSTEDSLVVMARIAELEAENAELRAEQDPNWHLAPWFGQPTPPVGLEGHTDPTEAQ